MLLPSFTLSQTLSDIAAGAAWGEAFDVHLDVTGSAMRLTVNGNSSWASTSESASYIS